MRAYFRAGNKGERREYTGMFLYLSPLSLELILIMLAQASSTYPIPHFPYYPSPCEPSGITFEATGSLVLEILVHLLHTLCKKSITLLRISGGSHTLQPAFPTLFHTLEIHSCHFRSPAIFRSFSISPSPPSPLQKLSFYPTCLRAPPCLQL